MAKFRSDRLDFPFGANAPAGGGRSRSGKSKKKGSKGRKGRKGRKGKPKGGGS